MIEQNQRTDFNSERNIYQNPPVIHVKTIWDWKQRWNVIPNGRRIKRKKKR